MSFTTASVTPVDATVYIETLDKATITADLAPFVLLGAA